MVMDRVLAFALKCRGRVGKFIFFHLKLNLLINLGVNVLMYLVNLHSPLLSPEPWQILDHGSFMACMLNNHACQTNKKTQFYIEGIDKLLQMPYQKMDYHCAV